MLKIAPTVDNANPLYRWEPRHKVPALAALIFAFAVVRDLRFLPVIFAAAFSLYLLSGLPFSFLLSRLRLPGFFLAALALILPFWSGETVLFQYGLLSLRLEGSLALLVIWTKFVSIIGVALVLFAATPLPHLAGALRSLGLPPLFSDMALFTYRYIFQLAGDIQRTRTAARLRGFQGKSLRAMKPLAYMVGSLLVRSHAQAERVFQAMVLRGYGRAAPPGFAASPTTGDRLALAGTLLFAAALVLTQALFF